MAESLDRDAANNLAEYSIVMIDLNRLKLINDQYGHERGNEYIIGSCRIICKVFKHSPVFRIGGDEFAAILQGDDYHQRVELNNELKKRFGESSGNEMKRYSASVGMSTYENGDTVETVFKRADQAMYEDKSRTQAESR